MHKYTSIDRIFAKIARDYGDEYIVENDIIEWCGEALGAIGTVALQEEAVAFIEVANHQAKKPLGFHSTIQIARNSHWTKVVTKDSLCPQIIRENCVTLPAATPINPADTPASIPVALDCNGEPINDFDLAYYRPYFDLRAEYYIWSNCNYYKQYYNPVRKASSTFFDSVVVTDKTKNPSYLYPAHSNGEDEYKEIANDMIRFSFKEGSIALAYNRQIVDEVTGYPMIPDTYSHIEAISRYVKMKILDRMCFNGREASCGKADKAAADWQWYCSQAGNLDMMPKGIDDYQDLLDQRSYMIPRNDRYFGFFGKLSNPEGRKWNDPDHRNVKSMYFRGY